MTDRIAAFFDTMVLGETAVVRGVRVRRRSLLGFEVAGQEGLLDAREAARRIGALAKCRPVRVAICSRCGGDGRGRRDRGVCGLCHGSGIEVVAPPLGWREAQAADVEAGVAQALAALRAARPPCARASLAALLREALEAAPAEALGRTLDELRRAGLGGEAAELEAALRGTRAA